MFFHRRMFLIVTLPALVIGLLLGIVCVLGVRSLNRLQTDRSRLLAKDVASLEAAQEVEVRLRQLRFHSFVYIHDPTPARSAVIDADHRQMESALRRVREATDRPEDLELVRRIEWSYRAYRIELEDRSRWPGPDATRHDFLVWADAHPSSPLQAICDELLDSNRRSMESSTRSNAELTEQTRWMMIVLGILGPLAGIISGAGIAWSFGRSYARLQLRIRDTRAELDRDLGSIRVSADGDPRQLDLQMDAILHRVRAVVAQLHEQQRELIRSEQMAEVGHLAAGVAHEVRNPLTGVKLLIEAALRPDSGQALNPDELRMILGEILRVERTVQGLLDFARPTSSLRQRIDLAEILRRAIDSVRGRAEARGVEVVFSEPTQPAIVSGDADQLLASIANLLINAVEASPTGCEVRAELSLSSDSMMRLEVSDRGSGIAPAMLPRLFTPFATDKPTGTGLGLCVARRIAREHGGDLTAENSPDGGARFTILLPRTEAGHAEIADRR